jgi:hypothetical protein
MTVVNWRKSASRDIRPFFGVATLEQAVEGAQVRLFEESLFTDATAFIVEEQEVAKLSITLRPNLDEAAIAAASIPKAKLVLAVTALNPFLKKTCVVLKAPLSGNVPDEVTIGSEVLEQLGGGSNMTIEVALCLAKELPKTPGSPFLLGHWLSKKTFDLRPPKLSEDFDIEPMDDDGWKARGLPPKTLYFVDYFGFINEPVSKDKQMAKVRIHSDVHKKLSLEANAKVAKPMMAFLAAEITSQILASSLSDWEQVDEAASKSPLAAFLKRINRIQPCTLKDLKAMVKESGMAKLRAILHADQQSVRSIAEG